MKSQPDLELVAPDLIISCFSDNLLSVPDSIHQLSLLTNDGLIYYEFGFALWSAYSVCVGTVSRTGNTRR